MRERNADSLFIWCVADINMRVVVVIVILPHERRIYFVVYLSFELEGSCIEMADRNCVLI